MVVSSPRTLSVMTPLSRVHGSVEEESAPPPKEISPVATRVPATASRATKITEAR